jgi:hypothetical protein
MCLRVCVRVCWAQRVAGKESSKHREKPAATAIEGLNPTAQVAPT